MYNFLCFLLCQYYLRIAVEHREYKETELLNILYRAKNEINIMKHNFKSSIQSTKYQKEDELCT